MIYRGCEIKHEDFSDLNRGAGFYYVDDFGFKIGPFVTEEVAMSTIDEYRKAQRQTNEEKKAAEQ